MHHRHLVIVASAALALAVAACGKTEEPPPSSGARPAAPSTAVVAPDPAAKAREIFASRCAACHGATGRGDGAVSASLEPAPRNFHDPAWLAEVTDDYLTTIIRDGGQAVGKSTAMPGNPDLKDPALLAALAVHVRELGKQP